MSNRSEVVPASSAPDLSVSLDEKHVALVEIQRPPDNFFDLALVNGIAETFERLAQDGQCRAIVLCSAGRNFCAGAMLRPDMAPAPAGPHLYDAAIRLFEQPLPVIASVQGGAIGGGLGLALSADFRIASPESRFSANFAKLGFHHGFGLTATLPRAVGDQAALAMLYTGRRLSGAEAYGYGLCDRLVDAAGLRREAYALAIEIAACAPLAVRSIRKTMRTPLVQAARAAMAIERARQEELMLTEDWREGVAAVSARRTANFQGR